MNRKILLSLVFLTPGLLVAQPHFEQLEKRLADATGRARLDVLVELTTAYRSEDSAKAVAFGAEALELLKTIPDEDRELTTLNSLCDAYTRLREYSAALRHGARAERLARTAGNLPELVLALNNLGDIYRQQNEYEPALRFSLEAIRLSEELDDPAQLGDALNDTGAAYRSRGDFSKALEYYLRAHQSFQEAGDRPGIARALNSIGIIYRRLGQHAKALELYHQALEIQREEGDEAAVARLLNNIGVAHRHSGDPARAIEFHLRSMAIKKRLGDERGIAYAVDNIGSAYEDLGDFESALERFQEALKIREKLGERKAMADTLIHISMVHRRRGQRDSAIEVLERSLVIATEISARDEIRQGYHELAENYAESGRYQEAFVSFKQYQQVYDEIFNEESSQALAEMQARYESEKKEAELEILRQERAIDALELKRRQSASRALIVGLAVLLLSTLLLYYNHRFRTGRRLLEEERSHQEERERYIAEVEARNAEMERFTYTVSHDLKSPLLTIRGFLGFVKKNMQAGNYERLAGDMERIDVATEKMAQLLDELLELSRIGRVANEPQEVSLEDLARQAVGLVNALIDDRCVEVKIAPGLPVVFGDGPRLLEVLQNLIDNAVKFMGDQPKPRVEIGWRKEGEEAINYVRDNGIGIDPRYHEIVFDLFDQLSQEKEGTGIGLAIVKRIVEVHGGRIWVESEGEGLGSAFCFTLAGKGESEDCGE